MRTRSAAGYWGASGTSFATPIVSGVAAMVWAVNPDLTGAQVKQIICSTATRQVGYSQEAQDEIDSNRFDPTLTYGLVDAELAVYAALESLEVSDQAQRVSAGPVGTFSYVAPAGGYRGSMTIGADGSVTLEEFMSGTGEGTTSYYTMAVDEDGHHSRADDRVRAHPHRPGGAELADDRRRQRLHWHLRGDDE